MDITEQAACRREIAVIPASSLDRKALEAAAAEAAASGRERLIMVADAADIAKVRPLRPDALLLSDGGPEKGAFDKIKPVVTRELIDWKCRFIYMASRQDDFTLALVKGEGFGGIFSAPEGSLIPYASADENRRGFWTKLFRRRRYTRPLIKIGGIKRPQDANFASGLGADVLGFNLSDGAENIVNLVNRLPETGGAKVVSVSCDEPDSCRIAAELLKNEKIDAIEFCGECSEKFCAGLAGHAFYRKRGLSSVSDVDAVKGCGDARIMIDPFRVSEDNLALSLIYGYADNISGNIWISGIMDCGCVKNIVKRFRPELVEASECLDLPDGSKDPQLMRKFFKDTLYAK